MSFYKRFLPYAVAIGSTAIALLLSLWVQLVLPQTIGAFFYIAIAITAWYGGIKPGIVAIVLSVLALSHYFMSPIYQPHLSNLDDVLWLALFIVVSLIITLLSSNLRQSMQKVEQLSRKLADESAERLKIALNAARMGLWDWNIITGELSWSPEHEQLFGLPAGSFDGRYETFQTCLHPDDREGLEQAIAHSLQHHLPYHHEFRVVWADGSCHWIEGRGQTFYNEDGQPVQMTGTIMAIDQRKQAEIALQQLNAELEQRVADRTAELTAVNDRLLVALMEQQRAKQAVEDLYNNAPCGYHSLDAEGTIVRINDTELRWLGYSRNEVINIKKFVDFITPESQQTYYQHFAQFLKQGRVDNLEFQVRHKDGSTRWVNVSSTAITDDAGRFVMSRTTLFDISKRKRIEEERKQAEQKLALQAVITRNMAEGICLVKTDDATIVYANPKFEQMFGYEPGELNGQHVSIVNYANDSVSAEDVSQMIRAAVLQNNEASYEVQNVRKDGTSFWCSATCSVFNHPDHGDVLVAVHQDITERKQAEAVLQETERRWRSLLTNVQLIVVGLDQAGCVNYVNPFFLNLTGYLESEVIGKNWFDNFLPLSQKETTQAVFFEILDHKSYSYYQNSILTKSGEERFIAWNNTMLQDVNGKIIGSISIGEDVTERYKVEQIKSEFIGIVSHELRTPLTSIQMSLGLLKSGVYAKKPDKIQRMIEIALIDTNRLVNLVNDILDLERLDSGRTVLEKTVCQAYDLMKQAADGVQAIATQQNITLTIIPTDAVVRVAPDTIIQTLTNLLGNAIKFSPSHSVITLQADRQMDVVLFQVKDQGRGIPEDKLEIIFGRFQQVDASDSREKGGTGLGLSICRSIVERHGGKIWAESIPGEGSTFFFTLPLPVQN